MAKQDNTSFDKKTEDKNKHADKRSGTNESAVVPNKNLDTQSEFSVNELREEKRDAE